MHVRYSNAAVAVDLPADDNTLFTTFAAGTPPASNSPDWRVYWATRAWENRSGRLLGFRLSDDRVELAVATDGQMRWRRAERYITEREAHHWLSSGQFRSAP